MLAVPLSAQFRLASNGVVTVEDTPNDSTYIVTAFFNADRTGNGYRPNLAPSDLVVFSQSGQLYKVASIADATLSFARLTITEFDTLGVDTEGAPTGQIMAAQLTASGQLPQVPYNATLGANELLQGAIATYNSVVAGAFGNAEAFLANNVKGKILDVDLPEMGGVGRAVRALLHDGGNVTLVGQNGQGGTVITSTQGLTDYIKAIYGAATIVDTTLFEFTPENRLPENLYVSIPTEYCTVQERSPAMTSTLTADGTDRWLIEFENGVLLSARVDGGDNITTSSGNLISNSTVDTKITYTYLRRDTVNNSGCFPGLQLLFSIASLDRSDIEVSVSTTNDAQFYQLSSFSGSSDFQLVPGTKGKFRNNGEAVSGAWVRANLYEGTGDPSRDFLSVGDSITVGVKTIREDGTGLENVTFGVFGYEFEGVRVRQINDTITHAYKGLYRTQTSVPQSELAYASPLQDLPCIKLGSNVALFGDSFTSNDPGGNLLINPDWPGQMHEAGLVNLSGTGVPGWRMGRDILPIIGLELAQIENPEMVVLAAGLNDINNYSNHFGPGQAGANQAYIDAGYFNPTAFSSRTSWNVLRIHYEQAIDSIRRVAPGVPIVLQTVADIRQFHIDDGATVTSIYLENLQSINDWMARYAHDNKDVYIFDLFALLENYEYFQENPPANRLHPDSLFQSLIAKRFVKFMVSGCDVDPNDFGVQDNGVYADGNRRIIIDASEGGSASGTLSLAGQDLSIGSQTVDLRAAITSEWGGLGGLAPSNTDFNDITTAGKYPFVLRGSYAHGPTPGDAGSLFALEIDVSGNAITQRAVVTRDKVFELFIRHFHPNDGWSAWTAYGYNRWVIQGVENSTFNMDNVTTPGIHPNIIRGDVTGSPGWGTDFGSLEVVARDGRIWQEYTYFSNPARKAIRASDLSGATQWLRWQEFAFVGNTTNASASINYTFTEANYQPTLAIQYDSLQPNAFIELGGDLNLSVANINSGIGEVDVRITSDTQRVTLVGEFIGNDAFDYSAGNTLLLRYEVRSSGNVLWFNRKDPRFVDNDGIINVPEYRLADPDNENNVARFYIANNPQDAGRKALFFDPFSSGINSMTIGTVDNILASMSFQNVDVIDDVQDLRLTGGQEIALGSNQSASMPSIYRTGNNWFIHGGPSQNVQIMGGGKWNFAMSHIDMNNRRVEEVGSPTAANHAAPASWIEGRNIIASETYDPPSIAGGGTVERVVTVSGVATGDFASVEFAYDSGITLNAKVTGTDQVTVRLTNVTGAAIDPASETFLIKVTKANQF